MSQKVQINAVAELMKRHSIPEEKAREIIEELNMLANPEGEDVKPPAVKKQFVFVLSDPTGKIRERIDVNNLVGWVVQIAEDASPHSTLDRIFASAYDYNASKKGRTLPAKSVGEALECVPARICKESELWVKTKMPIGVIVTDNVLPKDEFRLEKVSIRTRQTQIEIDAAGIRKAHQVRGASNRKQNNRTNP